MKLFSSLDPSSGSRSLIGVALALGALAAVGTSTFADREVIAPPSASERVVFPVPAEVPAKPLHTDPDRSALASTTADEYSLSSLSYVAITPYRTLDSRAYPVIGDMFPGEEVVFTVWDDFRGVEKIPRDIRAVSYNLTVTGTWGVGGYLALFPANVNWPGNSSINWFGSGLDLSNGGIVAVGRLNAPGQVSVYAGQVPGTATYFILDITGYFR